MSKIKKTGNDYHSKVLKVLKYPPESLSSNSKILWLFFLYSPEGEFDQDLCISFLGSEENYKQSIYELLSFELLKKDETDDSYIWYLPIQDN